VRCLHAAWIKLPRKGEADGSLLRPELKIKLSRNQNTVQFILFARGEA
jgi:hypothetical protein